ncbi:folylpolyglutamate synthase/dihydrofolate synthase family protein [Porphyromonadaceae sp. NP-X]|jgi:dihydrofolate synthase/folylpolyglutamate synthase|nr:bifunctional folylpolyglutamate synthase/dihydrofolate synthase [Paludibacteraceae bacterium]MDS1031975.1 folylpolyglutamate synthase/dihydrofolate synthase family protein [Porphyromonadaceae sp. NP-X]
MNYEQTLDYLYSRLPVFHQIGSSAYKPGLENTIRILTALHQPQNSFRSIHVAGTNGKGSVSHFLSSILQSAGFKTGLYTSPHLVDFGERIRVNGETIDKQFVVDFVENHKSLIEKVQPSFFEITMAMAFDYFAKSEVDVAVIEVGLGGRLDSTNIIQPELSIITNISFDHEEFLGHTLPEIAAEKAGIIKPHTSVVIGEALSETKPVFMQKALEMNAPIFFSEDSRQVFFERYEENRMWVKTSDGKSYLVGLTGNYQLKNIATVLTAVDQLRKTNFEITEINLKEGLEKVIEKTGLQGRWQIISSSPKIIADTGHNPGGITFVSQQLKTQQYRTLRMVFGMVNDKDIDTVLTLLPKNGVYYFTQAKIKRAFPSEDLLQKGQLAGLNGKAFSTIEEAIKVALNEADKEDLIFIGGSNYVVGEALSFFGKDEKVNR